MCFMDGMEIQLLLNLLKITPNIIIYEKGSFIPLVQAVYLGEVEVHQSVDWSNKPYSIYRDPYGKQRRRAKALMMYGSIIVTI